MIETYYEPLKPKFTN